MERKSGRIIRKIMGTMTNNWMQRPWFGTYCVWRNGWIPRGGTAQLAPNDSQRLNEMWPSIVAAPLTIVWNHDSPSCTATVMDNASSMNYPLSRIHWSMMPTIDTIRNKSISIDLVSIRWQTSPPRNSAVVLVCLCLARRTCSAPWAQSQRSAQWVPSNLSHVPSLSINWYQMK